MTDDLPAPSSRAVDILPRVDDLVRLPRLALVAFAARAARWARSVAIGDAEASLRCLRFAEWVGEGNSSEGMPALTLDSEELRRASKPAANAARVAIFAMADTERIFLAAEAYRVAISAMPTARLDVAIQFARFVREDFEKILFLATAEQWSDATGVGPNAFTGHAATAGQAPWPTAAEPSSVAIVDAGVPSVSAVSDPNPPPLQLPLLIDPGAAPPEAIGEYLLELSTLYRMLGGSGIDFRVTESRSPVCAGEPA